jgi:hypothetical protein
VPAERRAQKTKNDGAETKTARTCGVVRLGAHVVAPEFPLCTRSRHSPQIGFLPSTETLGGEFPVKSIGPLVSLSNKQCDGLSVAEVLKRDIQLNTQGNQAGLCPALPFPRQCVRRRQLTGQMPSWYQDLPEDRLTHCGHSLGAVFCPTADRSNPLVALKR